MLLKALADHARHVPGLPPPNYRIRTLRWAITIDAHGHALDRDAQGRAVITDLADADHTHGIRIPAPYVYRSGNKPPPLLLVDKLQYVLAMPAGDSPKDENEANRRNDTYLDLLNTWADTEPGDPATGPVLAFFGRGDHLNAVIPPHAKPTDPIAVRIAGQDWPHLGTTAQECWQRTVTARKSAPGNTGICLSCAQQAPLLDSLPEPIKSGAIPAAAGSTRDAQLLSVNTPAQGRGGRTQLADIPLCLRCGGQAAAVLNALLADDNHRHRSADAVTVWWMKKPASINPLRSVREARPSDVAAIFTELHKARSGYATTAIDPNAFYALTLSANESRVIIRDWIDTPLTAALEHITAWFSDHEIADWRSDAPSKAPLWMMAHSLGRGHDTDNGWRYISGSQPDHAERDLMTAALHGRRPRRHLLHHLNHRIGADGRIDHPRAALLRLMLNRINSSTGRQVPPVLDPDQTDPAYVAGRMFAVLESLQHRALRDRETGEGPNTTIADKLLGSAKGRPRARMEPLLGKAQGHLRRLRTSKHGSDNAAAGAFFTQLCTLHDLLHEPLPDILDHQGQALFSLGYYQQHSHDMKQRRDRTTTDS
ncbi:type I-C CRISPR-associated protein Cas8c/Csd1 [Nocardiopsis sediminis]|uniref:Type I-C CRISPR-associated protein Cas8c/Csd1 n=1 Tax=Nocardiopsis sediminis TaxID=1778267 RepID=A0ABV8FK46_9ACTN